MVFTKRKSYFWKRQEGEKRLNKFPRILKMLRRRQSWNKERLDENLRKQPLFFYQTASQPVEGEKKRKEDKERQKEKQEAEEDDDGW